MIPTTLSPAASAARLDATVARVAQQRQLPPALVRAIIQVESSGNGYAWRHEPGYRYLWNCATQAPATYGAMAAAARLPPSDFAARRGDTALTEWIGQQSSWGAMQIMGAVARSYGFTGDFPLLCDPLYGVEYGCTHLVHLKDRFLPTWGWKGVIAAYNAGSARLAVLPAGALPAFVNQSYVDKVLAAGFDPNVKANPARA